MHDADLKAGITVEDAIRKTALAIRQAGVDGAERDARLLVAASCTLTSLDILRDPARVLSQLETERLGGFVRRRCAFEPVARILGEREFYGRPFKVTPATLDPRPETETLIEASLEIITAMGWRERTIRILDVGTGTGCILLTLLAELPFARGTGIDIDAATLDVARWNTRALGLDGRAQFVLGNGLDAAGGEYDLLVSNPPYIASAEIAALEPDVKSYDPITALDGGPDGLCFYREIALGLGRAVPSGCVVLEFGAGQAEAVARILKPFTKGELRFWKDLGGHTRCVAALTQF